MKIKIFSSINENSGGGYMMNFMRRDFGKVLKMTEIGEEINESLISSDCIQNTDIINFYTRFNNREIVLNDIVDDRLVDISFYIMDWNREDEKEGLKKEDRLPIKIWVNTDGGDATSVLNLIDTIQISKTPVITIGLGRCFSAGCILLMCGHKRLVFPHTKVLLHKGSTEFIGDIQKLLDHMDLLSDLSKDLEKLLFNKTKITKREYGVVENRDLFLSADDIVKFGFADKIITTMEELL